MDTTTLIKERPILFSGPMVQAILNGSKTQTRRVVKNIEFDADLLDGVYTFNPPKSYKGNGFAYAKNPASSTLLLATCPYGQPGDQLWVRETWGTSVDCIETDSGCFEGDYYTVYRAGQGPVGTPRDGWKPSIHMRRSDSRLLLEITSLRVERLSEISGPDCWAEGITHNCETHGSVVHTYQDLWKSINGADSWQANPWVWVVSFKVIQKGGGSCA